MSIDSIPVWEWCWVLYSTLSAILHLTLLLVIIRARARTEKSFFLGSFFFICIIQGFQEIAMFLTTTFINRFRKYRIICYEVSPDNVVVEWEYYWFILLRNNLYIGHILVASNRLSAFHFTTPNAYMKFWSAKTVILFFALGYSLTILCRAVYYSPNNTFPTKVDNATDIFGFIPDPQVDKVDTLTEIVMCLGTTFVCIVLYIITGIAARRKLYLLQERNKRREIVLLRCAIATFIMLIPPAARSILHLTALLSGDAALQLWTARQHSMTTETMFVFQPLLLLLSCPQLREQVWDLFFPRATSVTSPANTATASEYHRSNP